jgi:hypothetical protein
MNVLNVEVFDKQNDGHIPRLDVAASIPVSRFLFHRLTGLPFSEILLILALLQTQPLSRQ